MKLPLAQPGTSIAVKTGEWRSQRPIVDEKRCIKCAICMYYCPEGIMGKPGEVPDIDYDYCKGCALCAGVCPVKCIAMQQEDK